MYGARSSWPFRWREPLGSRRRCPKCGANAITGPAEDRCPYCGWSEQHAPVIGPHDDSVLPSLRSQIEEAIVEADDPRVTYGPRFIGYELPAETSTERWLLTMLFFFALMLLRVISDSGFRYKLLPPGASDYVWYWVFLPSLLYMLTCHSTFLILKPITIFLGLAASAVGVIALLDPSWSASLWNGTFEAWVFIILVGYQIVAGIWVATIAWRDSRLLRK